MQREITPELAAARQSYYSKIGANNYAPLWSVLSDIITPEPKSACVPCMWRFAEAKAYILEAGGLITAAEAERRVLILEILDCGARAASRHRSMRAFKA